MLYEYRTFSDADYAALQTLDLAAQQAAQSGFETLPEREREGRLSTSLAALKFYERTGHSFVAQADSIKGFALAQSVWQGDRPTVLVRVVAVDPALPAEEAVAIRAGLLHAVVKSAYDTAVYEVHLPVSSDLEAAARSEEAHIVGRYGVIHLGTRAQTAAGEKLHRD